MTIPRISMSRSVLVWAPLPVAVLFVFLLAGLISFSIAYAADSAFKSPTDTDTVASDWDNPNNAFTSNNIYTDTNDDDAEEGYDEFGGFGIAAGSTVTGISVEADARQEGTTCRLGVALSWNNGGTFTSYKYTVPGSAESTLSYGGSGDLWGHAWTLSDLSNANFVLKIKYDDPGSGCVSSGFGSQDDIFVDVIRVKAHYTLPNTAPVANPQSVSTSKNTAAAVVLSGTDADGDPMTFGTTSNPTSGTLSGTGQNLTYTPNTNFVGSDSFDFTASDAGGTSTPATVSITVTAPANNAPVANAQSVSTNKNVALAITLGGSDVDVGDTLTFSTTSNPTNGTLSPISGNQVTYTPNTDYFGPDSFDFVVSDGSATSSATTTSITVQDVVAQSSSNGGGGGNRGRSGSGGGNGSSSGGGQVLGTTTEALPAGCSALFEGYLKKGADNDVEAVKRLQIFLNAHMDAGLPITGHFGLMTFAAVENFQVKHSDQVLKPWVPYGLPSEKTPTGYVYKTTSRWVNLLNCSKLDLPMPQLP